jgi:hypothetical protein
MSQESASRRQHARLTFNMPVSGDVTASHDVQLLDLGLGGARLEHTIILRPGSSCYIRLPLQGRTVTVMCRVIWSRAVGRATGDRGGTGLLYQSGVEFARLAQDTRQRLAAFLEAQGK